MTKEPGRNIRQVNQYVKYAGIALQLFVMAGVGAWLGQLLDKHFKTPKPYFTILLILVFTGVFFYRLIIELNRSDES